MNTRTIALTLACLVLPGVLTVVSPGLEQGHECLAQSAVTVTPRFAGASRAHWLPVPSRELRRPRVGLVLSGGGARSIAQIGVLRVLERHKIPVDFIAGTSFGAVVGGLYASGWTVAELESLMRITNWDEVLSLAEESSRRDLFVDQKLSRDRSFLVIRFEGLTPVIPPAVSSGQRLTDLLATVTLQSPYHPFPDFDALKIPFRAVTTDLVYGKRVVLGSGSLGEALRAAVTVPLLFTPITRDSMQLVDGGLLSNIPVDVVRNAGCDLVIAVNSTSGLRSPEEMKAPWETADQIMGIMMKRMNELQMQDADAVITPDIGRHLFSNFRNIDSLIAQGERTAEQEIGAVVRLYRLKSDSLLGVLEDTTGRVFRGARAECDSAGVSEHLRAHILGSAATGVVSLRDVQDHVNLVYQEGSVRDVRAEIVPAGSGWLIRYLTVPYRTVHSVRPEGCERVPREEIRTTLAPLVGVPFNVRRFSDAMESVVRLYRARGLALAEIDSVAFHDATGELVVRVNEGVIGDIRVAGGTRTRDWFVRRDFPLRVGDVFDIEKARTGVINIASTSLFEYVGLDVTHGSPASIVTIRITERPSQLVRLGVRADNERSLQGLADIRDENFLGAGMELGATIAGGSRNIDIIGEYKAPRIFDTYLTANLSAFYRVRDAYLYADGVPPGPNEWTRDQVGEYRTTRYGGVFAFGGQLERLGYATVEFDAERNTVRSIENATDLEEANNLRLVRVRTLVDSKNVFPFPTKGVGLDLSYELAFQALGGTIGYNALRFAFESFSSFGGWLTFHPRFTVGFADRTMPLSQQFSLGGHDSFFGLREDDSRGRQLLLGNFEFRSRFFIDLVFPTYVSLRYDLGTISAVPEDIKLNMFRHGLGLLLSFDTPVGPASFAVGESFYFDQSTIDHPIQSGPVLFSFQIGYTL